MKNIILIGMPGAGKSTIGVLLAKACSLTFYDTDLLIQARERRDLQTILDTQGYMRLRQIEAEVILGFNPQNAVVATGGSAVHSAEAIRHLGNNGIIVYLKLGVDDLLRRITNMDTRGIAKPAQQSFEDLYRERHTLYHLYCDAEIECAGKTHEAVVAEVVAVFRAITAQT